MPEQLCNEPVQRCGRAMADQAEDDASAYLEAAGFDFEPPPDYEAPEPSTAALQELLEIVDAHRDVQGMAIYYSRNQALCLHVAKW